MESSAVADGATDATCGECSFHTVFVTSTLFPANLMGVGGANAQCQSLASVAGLKGTYLARLSAGSDSPSAKFKQAAHPYKLTDGTVVANDWKTLVGGSLSSPINVTEKKLMVGAGLCPVWSNTTPTGASKGMYDCVGFTSVMATDFTSTGDCASKTSTWTDQGGLARDVQRLLAPLLLRAVIRHPRFSDSRDAIRRAKP